MKQKRILVVCRRSVWISVCIDEILGDIERQLTLDILHIMPQVCSRISDNIHVIIARPAAEANSEHHINWLGTIGHLFEAGINPIDSSDSAVAQVLHRWLVGLNRLTAANNFGPVVIVYSDYRHTRAAWAPHALACYPKTVQVLLAWID